MRAMATTLGRDIRTIPNLITLSRIVLMLIATALYFAGRQGVAIALAVLAGVTDYLDGAIARATGQVTRLGEILDQFCDLCYESLALTVAIHAGFFPPYFILLYLFREFWVLSIRRSLAYAGKNIPSSLLGKLKTNLVMWGFLPTFLALSGVLPGGHAVSDPGRAHHGERRARAQLPQRHRLHAGVPGRLREPRRPDRPTLSAEG